MKTPHNLTTQASHSLFSNGKLILALFLSFVSVTFADPVLRTSTSLIRPETGFEINFDKAVVKQEMVNQLVSNKILKIAPKWNGQVRWTSTNTVEFLPSTAPEMNTNYAFNLVKGLKHLDGTSVGKTHLRMVKSEPFDKAYSRTFSSLRNSRVLRSYLRYNDDISPATAAKSIYYVNKAGLRIKADVRQATWGDLESSYYVKPSWQNRFNNMLILRSGKKIPKPRFQKTDTLGNGLIVTPVKPLSVGENWTLMVRKGVMNESNTHKTNTIGNAHIGTLHPLVASSITPAIYADEARRIYISFNSTLPRKLTHDQMAQFIDISPMPANLKFIQSSSATIKATGDFYAQENYSVTVKKGFGALNGLTISSDQKKQVEFSFVSPGVGLPSFALSQHAKGQRSYSIDTVNMEQLQVKAKQLNLQQAIRVYQGYSHYTKDDSALPYDLISGDTVYDKVIKLDNAIDSSKEIQFNWNEILPNKEEYAVVFFAVEATPKFKVKAANRKLGRKQVTQSLIQLTDIGLAWKISKDRIWIYSYSCETGQPMANVDIALYGKDAKKLITAKTDSHGLCELTRDKEQETHIVASHGKDVFITELSRSISKVSMWRFPVDFNSNETNYWERDVMLFSDRSLYKPGEKVRIKGILRETKDNLLRLSKDSKVGYVLQDNQYREITKGTLDITANGSFDLSYQLPAEKVGAYRVVFEFENQPDNEQTGEQDKRRQGFDHTFHVQEFRRNAFEIVSHLPKPEPATEALQLDLEAKYYQGTPIADGKLKWFFSATPTGFYPEKFRDFQFGDHRKYDPYYWSYYFGYNDSSSYNRDTEHLNGNATLSIDGTASVQVDLPKPEFPSPQRITFESEITDSRNQTLTNTTSSLVHPASHYYGISRVDRLVRVDDQVDIQLVHIDLKGNYSQLNTTANLKIQREYNESVRTVDSSGKESVKNQKRIEEISTTSVEITGDKPNTLPFSASKSGRYTLTLSGTDTNNHKTATAVSFYVYGKSDYPWATEDGIRIKLVAEKKSYQPGDTARILVMTPIEGTALVTVERQGVLRHYKRELKAEQPVIEIPVEKGDAPNAYISVLIIRGAEQSKRSAKEPALKLGICAIKVEDKTKRLNVALNVEGDYHRPGEDLTVTGKITDHKGAAVAHAEVTLYAEDEGVLAVMGYKLPKPLAHFHRARPLTLRTGVSLGYFISEDPQNRYYGNKGFVIGDASKGGASVMNNEEVNVTLRKNFDPCVFWKPKIITDAEGNFSITAPSPDTLTRYRIMAVALSGASHYGSAKSSVVVSKDLMLEPAAPRFAHEGDKLTPKLLVQNTSKFSGQWDISLTTGDLTQMAENSSNQMTQTISLESGASATLEFPVIMSNTGEAKWIWKAVPRSITGTELTAALSNRLSDAMESKFKVVYPRPLLKHTETIAMKNNRQRLFDDVDQRLMTGRGKAKLHFSNSLLLEASGAFDHLLRYPYGCVEQTTSSMMPWFAVQDLRDTIPSFKLKSDADVQKAIQKGADRLLSMQTKSGGLAYWPGGNNAEQWASSYGALGLIMAKQAGATISSSSLEELLGYLKEVIKMHPVEKANVWENNNNCRSLYVLAMAKQVEPSVLNIYYEKRNLLSKNARYFLALAIHQSGGDKQLALTLLNDHSDLQLKGHWMPHRADKAISLLAWSEINSTGTEADETLAAILKTKNRQGHWRTTWVNGWTLNAMASYARNVEKNRPNTTITLYSKNGNKDIVLSKDEPTHTIELSLEEAQQLEAKAEGKIFAKIYVEAKPEIAPAGAESHKGMKISRSYKRINDKGIAEPLTSPKVGDLVQVELTVTFPRQLRYVVIDDALPSIMETVNGDFATQKAHVADPSQNNWKISRRELRSDRALFFLNHTWSNKPQTISYLARITSEGTVHTAPAKVEAMYDPSHFALTEADMITSGK